MTREEIIIAWENRIKSLKRLLEGNLFARERENYETKIEVLESCAKDIKNETQKI